MSSLKAELRGETVPEFTLTIPGGWVRKDPTDQVRDEMLAAVKKRLMQAHRPDLYGQTTGMVRKLFSEMHRMETIAFFGPGENAPAQAYLPATLTATVRRGANGQSLDGPIAELIRNEGATALGDDKRFLRWGSSTVESLDGTRVATTTVLYLTPIPDAGRKRALQFTLIITHNPDEPGDGDFVVGLTTLFDAYLSTFTWSAA